VKMEANSATATVAVLLTVGGLWGIIAIAVLAGFGHQVPDALVALTTGVIGAVAGLLSPSPAQAGSQAQTPGGGSPRSTPSTWIYVCFIVVLGVIALTGLVGLIYLTKVSADLQVDLLNVSSSAAAQRVTTSAPIVTHAINASSSAETTTVQIPGGIVAIASAAVGAIAGLFVPSPTSK